MFAILLIKKEVSQTKYENKMKEKDKYSIEDMMFDLQKRRRITFSNDEIKEKFPDHTTRAVELTLNRLISQKKLFLYQKGFTLLYLLNMPLGRWCRHQCILMH